jgi:hypothetical protein
MASRTPASRFCSSRNWHLSWEYGKKAARTPYSAIDRAAARRLGRALPGIGDEAWLIKGDHTVIMRVGRSTAKLTLTEVPPSARADLLIALAHIVAARLTTPP